MKQASSDVIDEENGIESDLVNLARLASQQSQEDLRLFIAKLIRKYRNDRPGLSRDLDNGLKQSRTRSLGEDVLRRSSPSMVVDELPVDAESKLSLVKIFDDVGLLEPPILTGEVFADLKSIVSEHTQIEKLTKSGLNPTRSAIFVGPPGVGKTLSARWLASSLKRKLWVLDLSAAMSSYLGRTGINIRSVLDSAKKNNVVLLLDEIDSIAKKRSDESDVGELKRLVAVILQEIDQWPGDSLLLAATNHPELVDSALWRRFDQIIEYQLPTKEAVKHSIVRFLGGDLKYASNYVDYLAVALSNKSLADIEKIILRLRRNLALSPNAVVKNVLQNLLTKELIGLDKGGKLDLASQLTRESSITHSDISEITGLSRDTLRKYLGPSPRVGRGRK